MSPARRDGVGVSPLLTPPSCPALPCPAQPRTLGEGSLFELPGASLRTERGGGPAQESDPGFPRRPPAAQALGAREWGTKRPPPGGGPRSLLERPGSRGWRSGASPGRRDAREAGGGPAPPPGSTPRPLRAPCRLQLGHDPGLGPRTIGLRAGASGCATGRAGSLRGELRATPGARPLTAQAPFSLPYSAVSCFVEI